jgi:hypothetical protein
MLNYLSRIYIFENHGYGYGYAGAGTRARGCGYAVAGTRVRAAGSGYAGTGTWVNGYRYNGFFPKKKLIGPSQTRTRVPVYPPIPGHGYRYRGYGPRVHGYGLYPTGFSKPLIWTQSLNRTRMCGCKGCILKS